jgi:Ni/Fe-hydrogenase subunit HybB-like protein
LIDIVVIPTVLLALATAGYSAFLFGQAEGRDFWQSPLLLPHLLVAAVVAGSAVLLIAGPDWSWLQHSRFAGGIAQRFVAPPPAASLGPLLFVSLVAHGFLLFAELASRHAGHEATQAARFLTHGPARRWLWAGVIAGGHVAPMLLIMGAAATESALLSLAAALCALAGLWLWEDLWVRAGQSVPLS